MSSADLAVVHYVLEGTPGTTPNTGTRASQVLTGTVNFTNGETVSIGGLAYTFQTVLTNVARNVLLGASLELSLRNLFRAINRDAGAGTLYAALTEEHPSVYASAYTATTLTVTAKVPGTPSNSIATIEGAANASWGAATLAGGVNGTTAWLPLRYNSESINFSIENIQSEEIRPDRVESDLVQVSASSSGDVNSEMSYGSFDDWLEAVFCGTWSTNVLRNGSTRRFFTVRKGFPDISQYHLHRGCMIEGLDLSFEIGQIAQLTFNVMGFGIDPETGVMSTTFPGESVAAALTTTPMNGVTNFQDFTIDGVPYSGCISKLSMSLKNNGRAIQCLGSLGARDMQLGTLEVTGDVEFYFSDASIYERFVKGFEFDLRFALEDSAGNRQDFVLPRCKFETGETPVGGRNTDVMVTGSYRALYHAASTYVAQLTRTPA